MNITKQLPSQGKKFIKLNSVHNLAILYANVLFFLYNEQTFFKKLTKSSFILLYILCTDLETYYYTSRSLHARYTLAKGYTRNAERFTRNDSRTKLAHFLCSDTFPGLYLFLVITGRVHNYYSTVKRLLKILKYLVLPDVSA